MSRAKKIAVLAIIAMVLTMLPVQLFAAVNVSADRLYGGNRVETALAVCDAGWPTSARTVILAPANQENLVDALAASSLAGQENAPILLTDKNSLDPLVKAKIIELGTDIVYVVGAIADSVAAEVEAMNEVDAIVLKGANRLETTKKINGALSKVNGCFVVGYNALPDALSASSYAAKNGYAIIIADANGNIPAGQTQLGSKTYILGGPTLVEHIAGSTRIYGSNRYITNSEFAKFFMNTSGGMKAQNPQQKVFVANGMDSHLVDSLVVAPYAGAEDAFIFLTDGATAPLAASNIPAGVDLVPVALGGPTVVTDVAKDGATNNQNQASAKFEVTNVAVESLNDIKVTFSQALDEDVVELAYNFVLNGNNLTNYNNNNDPHDVAVMQADSKSVVVTMAAPQAQNKARIFEVRGGYVSMSGKDKSTAPHYTKDLTFTDTTVPTVAAVKMIGTKKIKVTFSESILVATTNPTYGAGVYTLANSDYVDVKIDGDRISNRNLKSITCLESETARNGTNYYARALTFTFDDALSSGAHQLEIPTGLGAGRVLADAAGFIVQKTVKDFTVDSYTTAPVVQSVTYDKGDIYVQFDRAMAIESTGYGALNVNNYAINSSTAGTGITSVSFKSDDTKVKIVPNTATADIESGTNFVELHKDLKDAWGNKLHGTYNQRYNFTVELDRVKPRVETVTCLGTDQLRIHFDEKIKKDEATVTTNYKITKSDGSQLTIGGVDSVPQSSAGADIDSDTFDLTFAVGTLVDSGYTLTIKGLKDMFGNIMEDYTTTFDGTDDVGPAVINADQANVSTTPDAVLSTIDATWAVLFFDTALDTTSATTLTNYQYVDGNNEYRALPADTKALLDVTGKIVTVDFPTGYTLDAAGTGAATKYTVRAVVVAGVKDKAGNAMQGMAQTCDIITSGAVAAGAALSPALVNDTFILYDDGDYIKAEATFTQELRNFEFDDFEISNGGTDVAVDSGYRLGKKVILTVSDATKLAQVRAMGPAANLNMAAAGIVTCNDAGLPVAAAANQTVYDERVKPKWTALVAEDDYSAVITGSEEAIHLTFSEAIDDTIRGNYLDDFYFMVGSTYAVPDSVNVTTNMVTFYNFKANDGTALDAAFFAGKTVTVKAKDAVDVRDTKDAYKDYNTYAPTSTNKTTGMSDAVE